MEWIATIIRIIGPLRVETSNKWNTILQHTSDPLPVILKCALPAVEQSFAWKIH